MATNVANEVFYPINFRQAEYDTLADLIQSRQSVTLVGIKRVGISNFLRYFLYNKKSEIRFKEKKHLFVPVDLDDLVYIEQSAFWKLTLKRIADAVEEQGDGELTSFANHKFLESLEIGDQMVTIDNIKRILDKLLSKEIHVTFFFIRFDTLADILTDELLANLKRVREVTNYKTCFVFTSLRVLPSITFTKRVYLKPASTNDSRVVLDSLLSQYGINLTENLKAQIIKLAGGHIQYLNLMALSLKNNGMPLKNPKELLEFFRADEELRLLSEEIFTSLSKEEQNYLLEPKSEPPQYLNKSGLINGGKFFNDLFHYHIKLNHKNGRSEPDFTKKEKVFFDLLKENLEEIVERFEIVETVWPDQVATGVTDWAIDRLASRLRQKLLAKNSKYKIDTVITRGYKLSLA